MGSQIHVCNDRSRTNWTSATDRYFIDLMLDQVHRGNRMGHTFNKQAWNDMLIMFNANFGLLYDVNILKTRYTCLWKEFNDIRNLLDQNGFSWDNARQMVIADNKLWDTYIRAHPDAQSYRNRTLMNFNDLCLIYAHTTADGRYSLSSHDIDFDDDFQVMNGGVGMNTLPSENEECLRTDCTLALDQYFVKLMIDQLRKGNKIKNTFKKQAWKDMVTLFNSEFGYRRGQSFLKHRYKKLLKYYSDIRRLLELNGFSWDEKRQIIVADDDVWDKYIEAHPDAHVYRKKTLLSYQDLVLIYGDTISNGFSSHTLRRRQFEGDILEENGENREGYSSANDGCLNEGEDFRCNDNGDPSSAEWTPLMDRHLIDLMLAEGHRVKMVDYSFDNLVWIDMTASFKERFGLQHDKDFFRCRYRSLGKKYHELKKFLNQRGFWWDETQNLVTGFDETWDEYIKEHPHAKSFKREPRPNFNDLCLIYGDSTSDGERNEFGQDIKCNIHDARFNNRYHWKSVWTPAMDRHFINLMLEQVRMGNMVDQEFNKLAWNVMLSDFSAEFQHLNDKDFLKSQFLNLRKRFNDMKMLLDQRGFLWDEIRQMIIANDDLWDARVKEYPNARSYRDRTLPNFNDLFLIFGNSIVAKGQDYPAYSMDADYINPGVNTDEDGQLTQFPVRNDPPKMHWTKLMDRCFVDLMLEQVHRGNKSGIIFNQQAWAKMITSFNKRFGLNCDRDVLEDRYFSLVKEYEDVKKILNLNGFAWDEVHQTLEADDDVWDAYIEDNPDAIIYKDRILDSLKDMCLIYGNDVLNRRPSCLGIKKEVEDNSWEFWGDDDVFDDLQPPSKEFEIFYERKKRKRLTTSLASVGNRKVSRTMDEMLEAVDKKPSLVRKPKSDVETQDNCSIESVVCALQSVPDMNDELFLEACKVLEDERKAKMFVAMDVTARRKWLQKKLGL